MTELLLRSQWIRIIKNQNTRFYLNRLAASWAAKRKSEKIVIKVAGKMCKILHAWFPPTITEASLGSFIFLIEAEKEKNGSEVEYL